MIAFGPWWGFFYSLSGICFSAAVTWKMGCHMRRETVRRLAGARGDEEGLRTIGELAVLRGISVWGYWPNQTVNQRWLTTNLSGEFALESATIIVFSALFGYGR